ncbi:Mudr family transposase [Thalictrum thalictroides]|uniref:Mudr family transposase n=1 Tax=Thalictrum thalictroides TaxID=46969 RepID=A0A7J6WVH4_THATH|nr:Mudr family transposase [Thalictrum thalictroides]
MDEKKLITICQFGGVFETKKDGSLLYNGGEAHAIDIDHDTRLEEFKLEIAEMLNCGSNSLSIKYFLPGNRRTLITISNDKDLKRMISFNKKSDTVDIYVTAEEIVAHDHSNMPGSRSSRTTLSEAAVRVDIDITQPDVLNYNAVNTQKDAMVEASTDLPIDSVPPIPVDSAPPVVSVVSSHVKHPNVPSSWDKAITGVSQRFPNVHEFREALRKYAIAHAFAYKFKKNDSNRVTVTCKSESCPWRIHASRLSTTKLFCIKKMIATHTCEGGAVTSGTHTHSTWVAGIIKEKLQDSPKYTPKDIIDDIKREYGVELSYYQAWRGKEVAREKLKGSYKEAYSQLPFLCERVLETNPGSFATFSTKDDSSFHCLFISFHASVHGFQQGCRPLIFLDRLSLNSKFRESLLVATAADGDDGVYPVAFAVVDEETVDNWRWFLMELKSAVSTSQSITFVADTEKGLKESIAEVFENGYHSYCLQYLSENFKKDLQPQFSHEVKRLLVADFYAAASALKFEEFQKSTESIKSISAEAFSWIVHSKPEFWANAFFAGARYNHMTSKFGDLFYSWVSEAYEMTITQMVHMIRGKMMELIYARNVASSRWLTRLTPSMEDKLQQEILKAHSLELEVIFSPGTDRHSIYDVRGVCVERVDIDRWICSCKGWQITGLPCFHAIAVFKCINRSPYDYCSRYFTTESYRLTYSKSINPIPDVDKLVQESSKEAMVVTPPPTRRPPGRPKMNRNVSQGSDKRELRCSKCKGYGHNKITCKETV